jgi:hypothetical protein
VKKSSATLPAKDREKARLRICLIAVLASIAIAELVIGRWGWERIHARLPLSDMGNLIELETRVIVPNIDPEIVIFGNSRARDAFVPTLLEKRLGLRRGKVLSAAIGGYTIFDSLILYERHRPKLSKARHAIIQVDAFQLSVGIGPHDRYRLLAGWDERMAYSGVKRALLISDLFFRMNPSLPHVSMFVEELLQNGRLPAGTGVDRSGRLAVVDIGNDPIPERTTDESFRYWLREQYRNYEYSKGLEDQFVRLIRMAQQDGLKVWILQMPVAERYQAMLRAEPGDPDRQFRRNMERMAREQNAAWQSWISPSEAGLETADYRDWGHVNTRGSIKWTEFFSQWFQSQGYGRDVAHAAGAAGS